MIKELNVLFGIIVGYIFSLIFGIVDFSSMENVSIITYPKLVDFSLISFDFASILSILIIYIAGTTDSVGNTYTINKGILNEETTPQQIGGSIMATGLLSSVAALFGAFPLTPYGENVALMNNTKVINKNDTLGFQFKYDVVAFCTLGCRKNGDLIASPGIGECKRFSLCTTLNRGPSTPI